MMRLDYPIRGRIALSRDEKRIKFNLESRQAA